MVGPSEQGKLRIGLGEQAVLNSLGFASYLHFEGRQAVTTETPSVASSSPAKACPLLLSFFNFNVDQSHPYASCCVAICRLSATAQLLKLPTRLHLMFT